VTLVALVQVASFKLLLKAIPVEQYFPFAIKSSSLGFALLFLENQPKVVPSGY
jgi:hypothetical protein